MAVSAVLPSFLASDTGNIYYSSSSALDFNLYLLLFSSINPKLDLHIYTYHSPRRHFFPCFASSSSYVRPLSKTFNKKHRALFTTLPGQLGGEFSLASGDTTNTAWNERHQ